MKRFHLWYYETAADMEYVNEAPFTSDVFPDGLYSNLGRNRTIVHYNPAKMKFIRIEAPTLLQALGNFDMDNPGKIVVGIEEERIYHEPPVAWA